MYLVLNNDEQNQPESYPKWCNLSWFHDCRGIQGNVEPHYHDAAEIWLWHEGSADALVDAHPISMYPGLMVYTPAGCLHSYQADGQHSNTGIVPRLAPSMRHGHLHVEQTRESPSPEIPAFHFLPEENHPEAPAVFPPAAFLKSAYRGQYEAGASVLQVTLPSWAAVLVREGRLAVTIDGNALEVNEYELLILDCDSVVEIRAKTACELAFAIGWSPGKKGERK